jgi:hypothetical protein
LKAVSVSRDGRKVVNDIGTDLLEKIFNFSPVECKSILEVREVTRKVETLWSRLKVIGLEVMKMRTSCMVEYVEGTNENILGIKTIGFNYEKKRRVAATFWLVTSGHGGIDMNYPNGSIPVDVECFYGDVSGCGLDDVFSGDRGYGVMERNAVALKQALAL